MSYHISKGLSCCHWPSRGMAGAWQEHQSSLLPMAALPTPLQKQLQAESANFYSFVSEYCPSRRQSPEFYLVQVQLTQLLLEGMTNQKVTTQKAAPTQCRKHPPPPPQNPPKNRLLWTKLILLTSCKIALISTRYLNFKLPSKVLWDTG